MIKKYFTSYALKKSDWHLFNTQNVKKTDFYTIDISGISLDILKIYLNIYLFKVFIPTQLNIIFPVYVYICFFNEICISPKLKELEISGLWHFVAYNVPQPANPKNQPKTTNLP